MMATIRRKIEPETYTSFDDQMNYMIIEVLLPGVDQEMIKLRIFNECMLLFARNEDIHYSKSLNFVMPVNADKARAMIGNGILRVTVPLLGS